MLYDVVDDPSSLTPTELRAAYESRLREVIESHGVEKAAAEAGVDEAVLASLIAGEETTLTLSQAAAILALADGSPDADALEYELRDHLLMGMSTGILDVDTIAAEIDLDRSGQEIQQSLEGRIDMTLAELAAIHQFIASKN